MSNDNKPIEMMLLPNTVIKRLNMSFLTLNDLLLKQFHAELGSPAVPAEEDWAPALHVPNDVRERLSRYQTSDATDVAALIYNLRIDIAGNLVGMVVPYGPKQDKILKPFYRPKCGIKINARIGYGYDRFTRTPVIFGFDVGFK